MLSWRDEEEVLTKRGSAGGSKLGTSPSVGRSSFERPGSLRKSSDYTIGSPSSPLNKANSLLRGPGRAADGALGSEGWWHHMDHAAANEAADAGSKDSPKTSGFVPQSSITGQRKDLWAADSIPESVAPEAPKPAEPAADVPAPAAAATDAPAAPAAPAPASAASPIAAAAGVPPADGRDPGWWSKMDQAVLNQAPEAPLEAGAVKKGERVMGGGFVPQFGVAGGSHYKSIFEEQEGAKAAEAVAEQVAAWAPMAGACAPAAAAAAGAAAEDDWSGFAAAPPQPKVA